MLDLEQSANIADGAFAVVQQWGGPWTEIKLEVLRRYLKAWSDVLKNQDWCTKLYIDAFAGTGARFVRGDSDQLALLDEGYESAWAQGSALIALETKPHFDVLYFVEKNRRRFEELSQSLHRDFPDRAAAMHFLRGDANSEIVRLCSEVNWKRSRAVVFLDPFGMQVDWATVEAIARTAAIDLWYLVPTAIGIGRTATRDGRMEQSWAERLDRMLGTPTWRTEWYETQAMPDLLSGTLERSSRVANLEAIEGFVQRRLGSVFAGGVAKRGLRLGPRGRAMYMLTFACANPSPQAQKTALRIANDLLRRR